MGCTFATATVWAADDPPAAEEATSTVANQVDRIDLFLPDGTPAGRFRLLPPDTKITRYGDAPQARTDTEIYVNEIPLVEQIGGGIVGGVLERGTNLRVADDLVLAAVTSCELSKVEVGVSAPMGEEFDAEIIVWNGCPQGGGNSLYGPILFEGLECMEENEVLVLPIPLPVGTFPPSSNTIWVSGKFNTEHSGFVAGAPPTKGFSQDGYDDPNYPCTATFGPGFPQYPHASVWAKVYARGACETHFSAYIAARISAPRFSYGRKIRHADDITLADGIEYCELSTYEIGASGDQELYKITADLREGNPLTGPGAVIPRTARVWFGRGNGRAQIASFKFANLDPPITLPRTFWITWEVDRSDAGALLVGDDQVGSSEDAYCWEHPSQGWICENFPGLTQGIFFVIINCKGEAPLGACCRVPTETSGATCANDVPATGCLFGRWRGNTECASEFECSISHYPCQSDLDCTPAEICRALDDPFIPPCGSAPCCWENNSGGSNCTNEFKKPCEYKVNYCEGCISEPGLWFPGEFFCEDPEHHCYPFPCYFADNDCFEELFEIECAGDGDCPLDRRPCTAGRVCSYPAGCELLSCCELICNADHFCCDPQNGWDALCAQRAQDLCPSRPTNDECVTAQTPEWQPDGAGWEAFVQVNNMYMATENYITDPGFCCHNVGVDERGYGTMWYKVVAMGGSMRFQTCDSAGGTGQDTIIEVFRPAVPSPPSQACATLEPLACSDDANACGSSDRMSSICLQGFVEGEILYVLLAAPNPASKEADYLLTFQSPCPYGTEEPESTECGEAITVQGSSSDPYENEVRFDCSGDPGTLCLKNTTLNCPGEPALEAMKNDVWIEFDPGCVGNLHLQTCEDAGASPDTTLAVYRDPWGGGEICPIQGATLLGANDDAEVSWGEHQLRPQYCSLGRDYCATDEDCVLTLPDESCVAEVCTRACVDDGDCLVPGESCVETKCVRSCTTTSNCKLVGETCVGHVCTRSCTTAADCPVEVPGGTCEDHVCTRPCDDADDCPFARCSEAGHLCYDTTGHSDCYVGLCSWELASGQHTFCDTREGCSMVCRVGLNPCTWNGGECPFPDVCIDQHCVLAEECVGEICESSCWPGSAMTVPAYGFQTYAVRLGGEFGSEPRGTLRFKCEPDDCNLNGIPDIVEPDCHRAGAFEEDHPGYTNPDSCDIHVDDGGLCIPAPPLHPCSHDCQRNSVPDECDIAYHTSEDDDENGIPDECEVVPCPADVEMSFGVSPRTDAGQPHAIDDAATRHGHQTFTASGPLGGADLICWALAETDAGGCGNSVANVVESPAGTYTITLAEPLQPGAETALTYTGGPWTAQFTALPGDVNASGTTDVNDLNALIDCLMNLGTCDLWQCDVDRQGDCTGADLERLVDLLNGAGAYMIWDGESAAIDPCS